MPDKYITLRVSKKRSRRQFAQPLSHPSHALLLLTLACGIGTAQVTTYSAASEVITPGWTPQTYPIPLQPPAIGGAGSYIVDTSIPTYTRIMRVTTAADSPTGNSLAVPALGDRNVWSTDGAHVLYMDNWYSRWYVLNLNLASWPNPNTIGSKTVVPLSLPYFSYINADLVYGLDGTWASTYQVSTGSITHLFDYSTMWPATQGVNYFTLSSDDRRMCVFNGGQDSGWLVGCVDMQSHVTYLLDVSTSKVNGAPVNGYTFAPGTGGAGSGIHSLAFGMSMRYLQVQSQGGNPPVYWDLDSVQAATLIPELSYNNNHSASGYNSLARGHGNQCAVIGGSDSRVFTLKPYTQMNDASAWLRLDECPPFGLQSWNDENHWAWTNNSNANPALTDKYPVFANITMHGPNSPQMWIDGEMVAFETDGVQEKVWHFFHNYTSYSGSGCPAYLVGPHVSRDGRWVLFNSDWMGTLGSGLDCGNRMDVFLAELKADTTLPAQITVTLTPSSAGLTDSQTQQFVATVANTSNTAVTWSMQPQIGTLSATGLYTSPAAITTQQSLSIIATSVADPTKTASATVTLMPGIRVSVTPTLVRMKPSQSQQFTATVTNTSNTAVTWTAMPAIGTISASGLYTAPVKVSQKQTVKIVVTSQADPRQTSTATVVLTP